MNTLSLEIRKLLDGYKETFIKLNNIEKSFEKLKKDFPSLISDINKDAVKKYIIEIIK